MTKKVTIVYTKEMSFVREDISIFSEIAELRKLKFNPHKNPLLLLLQLFRQFTALLPVTRTTDLFYIWFADYHAFLPVLLAKLFKKKSAIVLGGYDTMALKEIGYGVFLHKNLRRQMVSYAVRNADYLLGVDETMFEGTNSYIGDEDRKTGVKSFVKNIKGECMVVPTGYDPEKWKRRNNDPKKNTIVTIGVTNEPKAFKRKGFEFFSNVARKFPDYNFIVIGPNDYFRDKLVEEGPENLTVHSFIEQEEIIKILSDAKAFCQFSLAEGLPNTLCEAMLCECIPVGSNVNGIPKAIAEPRLIIDKPEIAKAVKAIDYAITLGPEERTYFRNRIIDLFPKSKRVDSLNELLSRV